MSIPKPLTDEELKFVEKLGEHFVLIPKNRLWHFLGGSATFAIAAFALSFAGVLAGMKSNSAVQAAERIEQIKIKAEEHLKNLHADTYIKYGEPVALESLEHGTYVESTPERGVYLMPKSGRYYSPNTRFYINRNPKP